MHDLHGSLLRGCVRQLHATIPPMRWPRLKIYDHHQQAHAHVATFPLARVMGGLKAIETRSTLQTDRQPYICNTGTQTTNEVQRGFNETRSTSTFGDINHDKLDPAGLPTRQHMQNLMGNCLTYANMPEHNGKHAKINKINVTTRRSTSTSQRRSTWLNEDSTSLGVS
jgi:hypothetical protein